MTETETTSPTPEGTIEVASSSMAFSDLVGIWRDESQPNKAVKEAFTSFARAAASGWDSLSASVLAASTEAKAGDARWLAAEVVLSPAVVKGSALRSLSLVESLGFEGAVAARIAGTPWVSGALRKEFGTARARERKLVGDNAPVADVEDSLTVSVAPFGEDLWPPARRADGFAADAWDRSILGPTLTRAVRVGLPLARELDSRWRVAQLARVEPRRLAATRKQHKVALNVLGRALDLEPRKRPKAKHDAALECRTRTQLVRRAGRPIPVRAALIPAILRLRDQNVEPLGPDYLDCWAELLCLTWYDEGTLDRWLEGLDEDRRERLTKTAFSLGENLVLEDLQSSRLQTLTAVVVPETPTHLAGVGDPGRALRHLASEWPAERLAGGDFLHLIERAQASEAVPALAMAVRRLEQEVHAREVEALRSHARELRRRAAVIHEAGEHVGTPEPALALTAPGVSLLASLERELEDIALELERAAERREPPSRGRVDLPSPRPLDVDLGTAAAELAFSAQRSAEENATHRSRVQSGLLALSEDEGRLRDALASLTDAPPEFYGALWEIGLVRRDVVMLSTVPPTVEGTGWGAGAWKALLLRRGWEEHERPLPDRVAHLSKALMQSALEELGTRLADPLSGPDLVEARRRSAAAAHEVAGKIEEGLEWARRLVDLIGVR